MQNDLTEVNLICFVEIDTNHLIWVLAVDRAKKDENHFVRLN